MKASDLFVKVLETEGVKYIFGIPGEENLDLLESLRKSSIELILTRNEQSAVFMAATQGRFTGVPGVALVTLGPGATNAVTGVGYAQLNGLPVVVITGQKPIKRSKQGSFQIIDIVSMMKPLTKWNTQIQNAYRITSKVRQAFKIAQSERPGAVHIELPEDIAREENNDYNIIKPHNARRSIVEDKALDQLKLMLEESSQPIILIGAGANRKRVTQYLTKFIEKYNMPFFESQMGKGVVDERLPQYVGTAALSDGDLVHKIIEKADLILAVGHDVMEKPTNFIHEGKTKTVHINYYEAEVDDVYQPQYEVVGDVGNLFWRLYKKHSINTTNWDHDEMYEISKKARELSKKSLELEDNSKIMHPRKFISELREVMEEDSILALDNGWYKIWIARNYMTYSPNTLLLDNTFATMGAGMPTGLMAKFLNKDKDVVVVTGDGGLLMNLGDLETAVRLNVDLTIIVLNNNSYGMIKMKQKDAGFTDYGLDLSNPDFVKLAISFGAKGYRINTPDEFKKVLENSLKEKGVTLIELPLEYPDLID